MTTPIPPSHGRTVTLAITNATKITGLVIAVHELLLRSSLRMPAVATAVLMMAGGQVSESTILAALDRLIGREAEPELEAPKPPTGPNP